MNMILLGYKLLDFESNGERVKGTQVFVALQEEGVKGQITDKMFFRDGFELPDLTPRYDLGCDVQPPGQAGEGDSGPDKPAAQPGQAVNHDRRHPAGPCGPAGVPEVKYYLWHFCRNRTLSGRRHRKCRKTHRGASGS